MNIIVNADDYGLSPGVNKAIRVLANSIKCDFSTTVMMNFVTEEEFERLKNTSARIGLHINLTSGEAILNQSELTDKKGNFLDIKTLLLKWKAGIIPIKTIQNEIKLQVDKFLQYGGNPAHFDAHKHFLYFDYQLAETIFSILKDYGFNSVRIPIEFKIHPYLGKWNKTLFLNFYARKIISLAHYFGFKYDLFIGQQFCGCWSRKRLKWILSLKHKKRMEIMIHPAFPDNILKSRSSLADERLKDYLVFKEML